MNQSQRLADFSRKVRDSSLKRFRQVKPEDQAWRPASGRLSFVDHLKHLVDADHWILAVLKGGPEPHANIRPEEGIPAQWNAYMGQLEELGEIKSAFIEKLTDADLDRILDKPENLNRPSVGSLILRGNLDHEIHHRGMVQLLLKLIYGE